MVAEPPGSNRTALIAVIAPVIAVLVMTLLLYIVWS